MLFRSGHLVLSTLHTNDAPGTIGRLLNMGLEPFMVTSSVVLIQAQRLVRTICKDCKTEYRAKREHKDTFSITDEFLAHIDLRHIDSNNFRLYKGQGCDSCGGSGYRGRMGIYEVMTMTENQKSLIIRGGSVSDITTLARKEGMLTLRESALRKALSGITTLDEVIRVTAGGH